VLIDVTISLIINWMASRINQDYAFYVAFYDEK